MKQIIYLLSLCFSLSLAAQDELAQVHFDNYSFSCDRDFNISKSEYSNMLRLKKEVSYKGQIYTWQFWLYEANNADSLSVEKLLDRAKENAEEDLQMEGCRDLAPRMASFGDASAVSTQTICDEWGAELTQGYSYIENGKVAHFAISVACAENVSTPYDLVSYEYFNTMIKDFKIKE